MDTSLAITAFPNRAVSGLAWCFAVREPQAQSSSSATTQSQAQALKHIVTFLTHTHSALGTRYTVHGTQYTMHGTRYSVLGPPTRAGHLHHHFTTDTDALSTPIPILFPFRIVSIQAIFSYKPSWPGAVLLSLKESVCCDPLTCSNPTYCDDSPATYRRIDSHPYKQARLPGRRSIRAGFFTYSTLLPTYMYIFSPVSTIFYSLTYSELNQHFKFFIKKYFTFFC